MICPFGSNHSENSYYFCKCNKYYDYNESQCIEEMPDGYYFINETLNIIAKCDEKCFDCSLESIYQNLCISCNKSKNYYPLFDEIINNNSFVECYNNIPYGYYIENDYYILDKRCEKFEEINFNNTLNYSLKYYNFSYYYCPYYYYCDTENHYFCTEEEN